jgi:outer membrane protein assembly factor BamA
MPVVSEQSALVGQFNLNLNHENGGSDEIPFYMRPHIGGSSTLRGFALDRFYGKNLMLMSLEYRYRVHPNVQAGIFHDAGQIFDRTGELTWFNWHRNYGLSFRFHSNYRTVMRMEFGHSREGFVMHLSFGERAPQPLGGAIRYGTYRR